MSLNQRHDELYDDLDKLARELNCIGFAFYAEQGKGVAAFRARGDLRVLLRGAWALLHTIISNSSNSELKLRLSLVLDEVEAMVDAPDDIQVIKEVNDE